MDNIGASVQVEFKHCMVAYRSSLRYERFQKTWCDVIRHRTAPSFIAMPPPLTPCLVKPRSTQQTHLCILSRYRTVEHMLRSDKPAVIVYGAL